MKRTFKLNQRVLLSGKRSNGTHANIKATISNIEIGQDIVGNPEEFIIIEFFDQESNDLITGIRIPSRVAKPYREDKLSLI